MTLRRILLAATALAMLGGAPALAQDTAATGVAATQELDPALRDMPLDDIRGSTVYGAEGDEIGEIQDVVRQNGELLAVMEVTGDWFDWNEQTVVVPMASFRHGEEGLMLPLTEDQMDAVQEFAEESMEEVEGSTTVGEAYGTE